MEQQRAHEHRKYVDEVLISWLQLNSLSFNTSGFQFPSSGKQKLYPIDNIVIKIK